MRPWTKRLLIGLACVVAGAAFILPWAGGVALVRDWLGITRADVAYQVTIDEGQTRAMVTFALPSGEIRHEVVTTPWRSATLVFHDGESMSLSAKSLSTLPEPYLRCDLWAPDGSWEQGTVGRPKGECQIDYRLGQWPPNDLTGSLIQV
jgi:hypothetical protein